MAQLSHVAIVPNPIMGHLIPTVEFARRLVEAHRNIRVTLIVTTIGHPNKAVKSMLESLPIAARHVYLPPIIFNEDPPHHWVQMSLAASRSLAPLREVLKSLSEENNLSAIVFNSDAVESVKDFNVPTYIFFPGNAAVLSFAIFSVEGRDMPDRKNTHYESTVRLPKWATLVDGLMVNSFTEMEEGEIKALREGEGMPPIYPIGPLVNDGSGGRVADSECLQWLDNQPQGSVIFISFGSILTLSGAQMNELANGLEKSGQKFLWIVRKPNETSTTTAFSSDNIENDPLEFLPKGFLERTKGKGLVVPNWGPQAQILSHPSTGGFLTHCGWNSTLESVVNGQPLIVWPIYPEQKSNAVFLSEHLKVGLMPEVNDEGIVSQEEVSKLVKALMEGEEGEQIRKNMKLLQNKAKKALSEDGDSTKALADLAHKWSNRTRT